MILHSSRGSACESSAQCCVNPIRVQERGGLLEIIVRNYHSSSFFTFRYDMIQTTSSPVRRGQCGQQRFRFCTWPRGEKILGLVYFGNLNHANIVKRRTVVESSHARVESEKYVAGLQIIRIHTWPRGGGWLVRYVDRFVWRRSICLTRLKFQCQRVGSQRSSEKRDNFCGWSGSAMIPSTVT